MRDCSGKARSKSRSFKVWSTLKKYTHLPLSGDMSLSLLLDCDYMDHTVLISPTWITWSLQGHFQSTVLKCTLIRRFFACSRTKLLLGSKLVLCGLETCFEVATNKVSLSKSQADAGDKDHRTSILWKGPKEFVIFETAWHTAVLKSTVMQANKIKVEQAVALLPEGQIPFLHQ